MAAPKTKQKMKDLDASATPVKASLSNYRQSPRKTRLVANLIQGKNVAEALMILSFTDKRASLPLKKLIESAYASAKATLSSTQENLVVSRITVDKGIVFKRMMPRARGSAARIKKRTSHVSLTLTPKVTK